MPTTPTPAGEALRALLPDGADPYAAIDLACHTAFLVRDRDIVSDLSAVVRADPDLAAGLIVALGALVDVDATPTKLLAWLGTEDGRLQESGRMVGALAEARQEYDDVAADTLPEVTLESMRAMEHAARLARVMAPCGTMGGHARHSSNKQPVCYRCTRARWLFDNATPEQRELVKAPLVPSNHFLPLAPLCGTVGGYDRHREFDERVCTPCLTAAASAVIRSPHLPAAIRVSCGSHVGYNKHCDKDEDPCTDCRAGQRIYDTARKRLKREAKKGPAVAVELGEDGKPVTQIRETCGHPRGFAAHKRNDEDPCGRCREAQRVYEAERKRLQRQARKTNGTVHQSPEHAQQAA